MDSQLAWVSTIAAVFGVIAYCMIFKKNPFSRTPQRKPSSSVSNSSSVELAKLIDALSSALSDCTILPRDAEPFARSTNAYWAKQESEATPACVIQPRSAQRLGAAVAILKAEHDNRAKRGTKSEDLGLFAVRGGGHSAVSGAASISGGVLIDLGFLNKVTLSEDGASVAIEAGARWMDVSTLLDQKGLAAVGGRNSHVGVGGLTLGGLQGGLSFFSPRFGLVCSNVISYEVVLANGTIATASESTNPDLWHALKGGANNFGIVTRFTLPTFPSAKVWSGFLYIPPFKSGKVLSAFHESVQRANPTHPGPLKHDAHAAGPIACFTYLQSLGISIISVNLVYTDPPRESIPSGKWPAYWKASSFSSIWPRIWSTCKARTLTSATDELNTLNPPGRRQVMAATTIKNDPASLEAAHAAYGSAFAVVRWIKGISWTLVMQPLVPDWARKGQPNPLGLDEGSSEPLVIVSFTVNWGNAADDERARAITRSAIEKIEAVAEKNGTGHRYRYLNYCADWQRPFEGYGRENWERLKSASRKYDPDGLFQRGCRGGFKLDVTDGET